MLWSFQLWLWTFEPCDESLIYLRSRLSFKRSSLWDMHHLSQFKSLRPQNFSQLHCAGEPISSCNSSKVRRDCLGAVSLIWKWLYNFQRRFFGSLHLPIKSIWSHQRIWNSSWVGLVWLQRVWSSWVWVFWKSLERRHELDHPKKNASFHGT